MAVKYSIVTLISVLAWPVTALSEKTLTLSVKYQEAESGLEVTSENSENIEFEEWLSQDNLQATDKILHKTVYVIDLYRVIEKHLKIFEKKKCETIETLDKKDREEYHQFVSDQPMANNSRIACLPNGCEYPLPKPIPMDCSAKKQVGNDFEANLAGLKKIPTKDQELKKALALAIKLANLMKTYTYIRPSYPHYPMPRGNGGIPLNQPMSRASASSLQVTVGGAQDYNHFKKLVAEKIVPTSSQFSAEGFISGFSLASNEAKCDQLLCVRPLIAIDPSVNKLYVQIATTTSHTEQSFHRKPLNLAIVLDVSGSMGQHDSTKQSRLNWAKKAIDKTLKNLQEGDFISIIAFNHESKIVVDRLAIESEKHDFNKVDQLIDALKPRGNTNVWAGLLDGISGVETHMDENYENRVLLITDAQLNTGLTDPKEIFETLEIYANQGIGITAIGLGIQFNQDLIHGLTTLKGSNYLFAQDGIALDNYFSQFQFLVSPVAFDFKVSINLDDIQGKHAASYGLPTLLGDSTSVLEVNTLFFTSSSQGGAMVLEFDLSNNNDNSDVNNSQNSATHDKTLTPFEKQMRNRWADRAKRHTQQQSIQSRRVTSIDNTFVNRSPFRHQMAAKKMNKSDAPQSTQSNSITNHANPKSQIENPSQTGRARTSLYSDPSARE